VLTTESLYSREVGLLWGNVVGQSFDYWTI
jgi:hypothetical protein